MIEKYSKVYLEFREKRFALNPRIKKKEEKKKKRSLFYQATKSYLAVIPFFTSFSFFNLVFFKRTLPSRAEEKRDRKREEFVSRVKQI